jgi:cytoskeletal protein RodZ
MKKIGQLLKEAREQKGYSLIKLENITKIKLSFIELIEKEEWNKLPAFSTVLGFVKNISTTLDIDEKMAVAILKRDYPPKKLNINPKPDISSKFLWSPKITFIIGVSAIVVLFFGYLIFQYVRFISPPRLNVESPKQGQTISGNSVLVFGSTDVDSKLMINNQPVLIDDDGKFSVTLNIVPETKEIDVVATSRSGKMTEVKRDITWTTSKPY